MTTIRQRLRDTTLRPVESVADCTPQRFGDQRRLWLTSTHAAVIGQRDLT
ncbi:MAG: hypothetical protein J4F40_16200 [Alphaproteobacteria bacterium]|nr:hypothetical protein [Alphaproteobacteria bacterium]